MKLSKFILIFLFIGILSVAFFFLIGGSKAEVPVDTITKNLKTAPTYSVILEDMREEGTFFKDYFHRYRVIQQEKANVTDWFKVPENFYRANEAFLGMIIAGKKEGEEIAAAIPPAYQYVGDTRYGNWRNTGSGASVWEFDNRLPFGELEIDLGFPIFMGDYKAYQNSRAKRTPFFGTKKEYGTTGSIVQKSRPGFFQRYTAKQQAKKSSFTDKVSQRIGRTKTSFRSRSGGRGK